MKNGMVIALVVFVTLLFAVIGLRDSGKRVGVQELKIAKLEKDKITRLEVSFVPRPAAAMPEPAPPLVRQRVILEKATSGWQVFDATAPDRRFDADEALVRAALDGVLELSPGDLIANKADQLATYEIDDDKGQTLKVSTGDTVAIDLVLGRTAKGGGDTVRAAGTNDVHVAKGRLAAATKKDLSGWRKKQLFDVKTDDIVRVAVTREDGNVIVVEQAPPAAPSAAETAEIEAGAPPPKPPWNLVVPASLPAGFRLDQAQLGRAASALSSARALDFADGVADDVAGLAGAHAVVEAKTRDGKTLVLHLGREDDKKRTYARVGTEPQLYLLPSASAKQLARGLDDLRDLTLVAANADDIERVVFSGATRVVLQRDGGAWKLVEPKKVPDGFELSQMGTQVAALLRLRGTRLGFDAPRDALARTGPVVEITLRGGRKQSVRFGAPLPLPADATTQEPREFFVQGGDGLTYVVPAFTRSRYDKPLELFRAPPAPPSGMGGGMGGVSGLENLPPDVRKKLEEAMAKGSFPAP